MQFKVKKDYLEIVETENTYAKAIDLYNIDINFSEEWDNLAKKMLFISDSDVYEQQIVDNKTVLPNLPNGRYQIGVVRFFSTRKQDSKKNPNKSNNKNNNNIFRRVRIQQRIYGRGCKHL
jgi:hypothetical protein